MTALVWKRVDDWHHATECGRFMVCKMRCGAEDHYIGSQLVGHRLSEFISARVPIDADGPKRLTTINAIKAACAVRAGGTPMPKPAPTEQEDLLPEQLVEDVVPGVL